MTAHAVPRVASPRSLLALGSIALAALAVKSDKG